MYKLYIEKNMSSLELLQKVLKEYHIEYDIFYNEHQKPYIKGNPLYFNISHSKDYIVCVVSDKEIGVDIEHITLKENLIQKICTDNEKKYPITKDEFTIMWVKKESYVKKNGIGLSYGLHNVDTTILTNFDIYRINDFYISVCY